MIDFSIGTAATTLQSVAPLLAIGTFLLLAMGCGLIYLTHSPVHRQRIGEMTLIGVVAWTLLACIPLPRVLPSLVSKLTWSQVSEEETVPDRQLTLKTTTSAGTGTPPLAAVAVHPPTVEDRAVSPNRQSLSPTASEPPVAATTRHALTDSSEVGFTELPDRITLDLGGESPAEMADAGVVAGAEGVVGAGGNPQPVAAQRLPSARTSPTVGSAYAPALGDGLVLVYVAGAACCLAWLVMGRMLLARLVRNAQPPPEWLAEFFRSLQQVAGAKRTRLIISDQHQRALSWGLWHPVIMLPKSFCQPENRGQLRTILLHELGHVSRGDAWGITLISACLPLLYMHPLFWWVRKQMLLAAELVADDWAAHQTGKETYVEDLVVFAKHSAGRSWSLPGTIAVLSSSSQFYRRMNMLLVREEPLSTRPSTVWQVASIGTWMVAVALATSIAGIAPAVGQQGEQPPAESQPAAETQPTASSQPTVVEAQPNPVVTTPPPATEKTDPPVTITTSPQTVPSPTRAEPKLDAPESVPPLRAGAATQNENPDTQKEKIRLLQELQRIEQRLQELNGRTPAQIKSSRLNTTIVGDAVTIQSVDNQGNSFSEVWLRDESGRATKLLSRTQSRETIPTLKPAMPSSVERNESNRRPVGKQPQNVVIHQAVEEDGVLMMKQYIIGEDGQRRELKSTTAAPKVFRKPNLSKTDQRDVPDHPPSAPVQISGTTVYGTLSSVPTLTVQPAATQAPVMSGRNSELGSAGNQLDLINLATSYSDAVGAVESAKSHLDEIEPLAEKAVISKRELTTARVALHNAERKEKLLRRIAQSAGENVKALIAQLEKQAAQGQATADALRDAVSRLDMINQILESNADNFGTPAPAPGGTNPGAPDKSKPLSTY